jgi:hypothetical protein
VRVGFVPFLGSHNDPVILAGAGPGGLPGVRVGFDAWAGSSVTGKAAQEFLVAQLADAWKPC